MKNIQTKSPVPSTRKPTTAKAGKPAVDATDKNPILALWKDSGLAKFSKAVDDGESPLAYLKKTGIGMPVSGRSLPPAVRQALQKELTEQPVTVPVQIDVSTYGVLMAGATIHKCTIEQMAGCLLGDMVPSWADDDYPIHDAEFGVARK